MKFSPEVRERAARLVVERRGDYDSQCAAVVSIAGKIGSTPQTLLNWLRQHERDTGQRKGVTTAKARRVKELSERTENCAAPTRSPQERAEELDQVLGVLRAYLR